ncbi:hypothetical protein FG386_002918 [Cryptosporidium ryanae]|uniref:uncharacterized protein n=1 Tax=Cryptosporidium ryanae TaxID=515981 RepID=UPI00351A5FC9|nr:hypothetical protein FG386_002918 [Cryptosporidium ryanae]
MSSLEKLIISGIRSFSPDRREGIIFESPITLIAGQNGSGKTTIIECLKASITGELPPNSKSGQYFIHDPKLTDSAEVRGQIRLIFRDYQYEKRIQVVRSFQLSYIRNKKTNINSLNDIKSQFKVIESILQTKDDETGEITSISHKCADINSQVPILFGVSDSVIENVLFCHQEDSNWPLQEMSKVKKRFDDLFGSTRYSKALEAINKIKNDYSKKIKEITLINDGILQKITFLESILLKKSECLKRKEKILIEIEKNNSKLKLLQDNVKEKEKIREKIGKLFTEFEFESKLLDSYSKDINEIKMEIDSVNLSSELDKEDNIDEQIKFEKGKSTFLAERLEIIQNEIQNLLQNINLNNKNSEFKLKLDQIPTKIREINENSTLLKDFVQELENLLSNKLKNFPNIDLNKYLERITKMSFNKLKFEQLNKLENELESIESQKNNFTAILQQKRELKREIQREIDQISSKLTDKNNIESEMDKITKSLQLVNQQNTKTIENIEDELNENSSFNNTCSVRFSGLFNITYELGVTSGEISILNRFKNIEKKLDGFEFDSNTNNLEQMISVRKEEYKKKKIETLSKWKKIDNLDFAYSSEFEDSNIYNLKMRYKLLEEKLYGFPSDLNEKKDELQEKLNNTDREISEFESYISVNEKKYKELTNLINKENIENKALESDFYKKKDRLLNSMTSLIKDFEYLFINRREFDFITVCEKNVNFVELLKTKQTTEKEIRNELEQSRNLIDTLIKVRSLKKKKQNFDHSGNKINCIKAKIAHLLNYKEQTENETYDIGNIEESYELFKLNINSIQNEIDSIQCELSRLQGENKVNDDWLEKCESDSKGYSNLENLKMEYSTGLFEHNLMISYIKDLDKYSLSLQKALMKFHVNKMIEINRTIKELWNVTYRGHDIDYIAIRSDAEDENEAAFISGDNLSKTSTTKSFNYRVVMVQNGVELDMKGKCSAGQKVLACIIIRLALAESFCLNCGILTLDEPTTNLDQLNIEGLAEALSYLIKFRKLQKNFQLIIITHDERFVRILAQAQQCDHFYQISKDENGYSTIRQVDFHGY